MQLERISGAALWCVYHPGKCSSAALMRMRPVRSDQETAWLEECVAARESSAGKGKRPQKGAAVDEGEEEDPSELDLVEPFGPKFTYPIFGDKETIFGYKGLNIEVRRERELAMVHLLSSLNYSWPFHLLPSSNTSTFRTTRGYRPRLHRQTAGTRPTLPTILRRSCMNLYHQVGQERGAQRDSV